MAKKNGLSQNCIEALLAFSEVAAQVNDDIHLCQKHKDKTACGHVKSIGPRSVSENIAKVWKYCRR